MFTPRLSQPDRGNKYYRSPNPFETSSEFSMWNGGNCTAYAWGRFHEAMGGSVTDDSGYWLPTYDAEGWWDAVKGYEKGKTPRLGAVLCLRDGPYSGCGHVAVVEQINSDGSIVTSESGWKSYVWTTKTRTPPNYNDVGYGFQGFIYNRTVKPGETRGVAANTTDAPKLFLDALRKYTNSQGHSWVVSKTGIGWHEHWCAATMCAAAKVAGFADVIMPGNDWGAGTFAQKVVNNYGGKRIDGPKAGGGRPIPAPGDLILYWWTRSGGWPGGYWASHIGVVESVSGKDVTTLEGNFIGDPIGRRTFNVDSSVGSEVVYYARPDWSKVGGAMIQNSFGAVMPLYTSVSTRADATLRKVAYLDSKGQFTTKKTDIGVTAINYTYVLGSLVSSLGGAAVAGENGTIDTSGITDTTARGVANYLAAKGLNRAAIAGIMGNIEAESSFRLDAKEMGYPYQGRGLCQWTWGRRTKFLSTVPNWEHNLQGQMDFLWDELTTSYNSSTLVPIQQVPDTPSGCYEATKIFVMNFEMPKGHDEEWMWDSRYERSIKYYNQMKVIYNAEGVSLDNIKPKSTIYIPSTLPQTGIVSDYTYYLGFSRAYAQGELNKEWKLAGSASNNNIATIRNHYMVAVRPKFGSVGDLLLVTLANGKSFTAVIADVKGSDATSDWGHVMGGSVSLIKWESVASSQSALTSSLKSLGWYGSNVIKVNNYGNYKSIQTASNGGNLLKVQQWKQKWPEGSRFPYPGSPPTYNSTPQSNKYGEAQCWAYAGEFRRFIRGTEEDPYGERIPINASLTPDNVRTHLKGVPAGTHLRFGSPSGSNHEHSVGIINVSDTRIQLGDCNLNHDNIVHYYDMSLDAFCSEFGGWSRYLGWMAKP